MKAITLSLTILAAFGPPLAGQTWESRVGDIGGYLMDEAFEIALATSAAPESVSAYATVWVLRRHGYEEVRRGTNGFTCLVERSWSSPIGAHEDFFNPKLRAPICYNEEASRTVLRDYLRRTELVIDGQSIADVRRVIETEIGTGKLKPPREVAMSFMMSAGQLLSTRTGRFKPHLMFYIPYATDDGLGDTDHAVLFEHDGGPFAAVVVPVIEWIELPTPTSR